MIIDEGFLSNAKKIAETKPQQSEVKAPVIKKENYEYHMEIDFPDKENVTPEIKNSLYVKINNCTLFREIAESKIRKYEMSYDIEVFANVESIYEFYHMLVMFASKHKISIDIFIKDWMIVITWLKTEKIEKYILDGNNIYTNAFYKKCSDNEELFNLFELFKISTFNFIKWYVRNDIIILRMFSDELEYYAATITNIRAFIEKYSEPDISVYSISVSKDISKYIENHTEENNSDILKFLKSSDMSDIKCIVAKKEISKKYRYVTAIHFAYPIMINGTLTEIKILIESFDEDDELINSINIPLRNKITSEINFMSNIII